MAGQFRFRLPWLTAATPAPPAPRPSAEPRPPPPPTTEIQAPSRPTTTIPIQRPPFRPAGIAPTQPPPPPPQAPPRTEPKPASPPRPTAQAASSVPSSPSRATTRTRAASVPPSPSRAATESQVAPQPATSPTRAATKQPAASPSLAAPQSRATSVPPSPSRTTSQPRGGEQPAMQPKSPPRLATQRPGQTFARPSSPTRFATQVQQPTQQEERKNEEITSHAVPKYQAETGLESERRVEDKKQGKRVVEEQRREGIKSHAEQKQQKEDILEKKTEVGSRGEQMKTVKARYMPSESHQKQGMSNGEKVPLHKEIKEDISKFVHKLGTGFPKQAIGDKPLSVVTIAGENRGASMHLALGTESARKDGSIHIHRGYKSNPDESTEATTDGEGSSNKDPSVTADEPAPMAYINSNTQSVNNSVLFESTVTEGNPGVHLSLSNNVAESSDKDAKTGPLDARKAEFNITPAEKRTYEPTVRRRCLRGLFLESSDSDPDNPEKPRRHGCRYACREMSKDKDIGIL
ncbi:hypothetical protein Tsubulata_029792 [Turnera subulata]|uniref:Uncharacterized protein n=1 Tax=Turnera subulata TaxID=218843 RepID=A0A9Q0F7A2_9ROSI|nr:hypothetical protein Tsubulata_029792 [Turnera subulata]